MTPAAAAASAALPFRAVEADALPGAAGWVLAWLALLMLLGLLLWRRQASRRGGRGLPLRRSAGLELIDSRALGTGVRLFVVAYAGRQLLIGVSPAGLQCLRDDPAREPASGVPGAPT